MKTGGKPAKRAAKPKPPHLEKPRKPASKSHHAKPAGMLSLRDQVNGATADAALADSIATEVAGRQEQSDERILLESLGPALAVLAQLEPDDQQAVRQIVST